MSVTTITVRRKIVSFISCIPGLLISSLSAGFLTSISFLAFLDRLNLETADIKFAAAAGLYGNALAVPGLAVFLIWSRRYWHSKRSSFILYASAGFVLALLNGIGVAIVIKIGDMPLTLFLAFFFAATGVLTASIHWCLMRYWLSPAVTLFKESAKKELYSHF